MISFRVLIALAPTVFLSACVGIPDASVDRVKYDDIADNDLDGVINQRDYCAHTPRNSRVDNNGCTEWNKEEIKETYTIDFDFDRAVLRDNEKPIVLKLVQALNRSPATKVRLIGDTSAEGTIEYNAALAKRRVDALAKALSEQGITENRIEKHIFTEHSSFTDEELHNKRERRTKAVIFIAGEQHAQEAWSIYSAENAEPKQY